MTDRKSILLVEDEAMISMMVEDFLEMLDYGVSGVATNFADACAAAEAGGCDAAILDCNLHGEKVWPVAQLLRARGVPFVFATGGEIHDFPDEFAEDIKVSKPFTLAALEQALQAILPR